MLEGAEGAEQGRGVLVVHLLLGSAAGLGARQAPLPEPADSNRHGYRPGQKNLSTGPARQLLYSAILEKTKLCYTMLYHIEHREEGEPGTLQSLAEDGTPLPTHLRSRARKTVL